MRLLRLTVSAELKLLLNWHFLALFWHHDTIFDLLLTSIESRVVPKRENKTIIGNDISTKSNCTFLQNVSGYYLNLNVF